MLSQTPAFTHPARLLLVLNPRRVQEGRSTVVSPRRNVVMVVEVMVVGVGEKEMCWTEPVVVTIRGNFVFRSKTGADEGHGRWCRSSDLT